MGNPKPSPFQPCGYLDGAWPKLPTDRTINARSCPALQTRVWKLKPSLQPHRFLFSLFDHPKGFFVPELGQAGFPPGRPCFPLLLGKHTAELGTGQNRLPEALLLAKRGRFGSARLAPAQVASPAATIQAPDWGR